MDKFRRPKPLTLVVHPMRNLSSLLVALTVTCAGLARSAAAAPQPSLPIERYQLDNGLEVILAPDDTVTSTMVEVWYHVGSKDEVIGKSGFAHLFEHLMFEGSKHVGEGQFDQLLEAAGGWNNGTTNNDRTTYFEQVPSNYLPLALWLEADRMAGLWDAMNNDVLTNQRDVVKNERRQSYENRPYGQAGLLMSQALWPKGHGNWNLTIGTMADLDAATLDDVEEFWRAYYRPSNATLLVVGRFDVAATKDLIAKRFAWMPKQAVPSRRELESPVTPLARAVPLATVDNVAVPKVIIQMRAPEAFGPGLVDLEVAAQILGGGKTSRLYKRLVFRDRIATEAYAYVNPQFLGSEIEIAAVARPGVTAEALQTALADEVAHFLDTPPTAAEIERAQRVLQVAQLSTMENLSSRANQIADWAAYTGDPDHLAESTTALRQVTAASIATAVRTWMRLDAAVTMVVRPAPAADANTGGAK
jgi:zinc protease